MPTDAKVRSIPLVRFDALGGYARRPRARLSAEEISWFEHESGRAVGAVIIDRADRDFGGIVLAQDQRRRFRWVDGTHFVDTPREADALLARAMDDAVNAPELSHHQGDETRPPVDFFAYARPHEQLNPHFLGLAEHEGYSPARGIIEPMMRWYEDTDGNFVEQFQTTGFDQRIWELYLFAVFVEMGLDLSNRKAVPDFLCGDLLGNEIAIEAVTVGPTRVNGVIVPPPPAETDEQLAAYQREYMPIKFGSALYSKLQKAYWKHPNVAGKPLVFAIHDFSSPMSMIRSRAAIGIYLFGFDHIPERNDAGDLRIVPRRVETHRWEGKTIPSGFFRQPGAENVSAVVFSNSGTIGKFNRMGILAGFGSRRVLVTRKGFAYNPDPNASSPRPFSHVINAPDYDESWTEGLEVFHNPNALEPLPDEAFHGAINHRLQPDGQCLSIGPQWNPLFSVTRNYVLQNEDAVLKQVKDGVEDQTDLDLVSPRGGSH